MFRADRAVLPADWTDSIVSRLAPIVAKTTIGVLVWLASWDLSDSAAIRLLNAQETDVSLASRAPSEGILLRAHSTDVRVTTWAMLPAYWTNAIVSTPAFWIAESSIVFLASRTVAHWFSDTTTLSCDPTSFLSALSKIECIIIEVFKRDCLSAGCKSSRKNGLGCELHF